MVLISISLEHFFPYVQLCYSSMYIFSTNYNIMSYSYIKSEIKSGELTS